MTFHYQDLGFRGLGLPDAGAVSFPPVLPLLSAVVFSVDSILGFRV